MRSSDAPYAAAGTDPPWPPLLKGGKLSATFAEGNLRSSVCKFSTGPPGPPFLRGGSSAQHSRREISAPQSASFQQAALAPPS